MARKSAVKPKSETDSPEQQALEASSLDPAAKTVSKAAAARAAIDAGHDNPQQAVAYIKKTFGIDMGAQHFSAVKSQLRKKEGATKNEPRRKPLDGYLAPPKIEATGEGDLFDALAAMKPLIAQFGADKVKKMVDLLG
jgi:hypothetical protein